MHTLLYKKTVLPKDNLHLAYYGFVSSLSSLSENESWLYGYTHSIAGMLSCHRVSVNV